MSEDFKINRKKLYKLYMEEVDRICDKCEWVTNFTPKDIINMISNIIELNPNLISKDNIHID